ncbi:MAG: glycosyltransferase family 4 protein [Thermoleophilia bacterium]|nr:glycosyltransferase family 4 protein [Thermoleophilia bacterium]
MRIGILTQYYPPEMGAPQARLSYLARRLRERGHEVVVLTAMPHYPRGRVFPGYGGLRRQEELEGVRVTRTYVYAATGVGAARLLNYTSFAASSLFLGTPTLPRLDYLVTECPPLFVGPSGYLISRFRRARWIFNVSDLWVDSALRLGVLHEGLTLRAARAVERFCYRKAWCITGQSQEILQSVSAGSPGAMTYHLPNAVVTEAFSPTFRSTEIRERLASGASAIAVYAGLHGYAQGLDQVLDAAQKLSDLNELRLVLVGDGPEKKTLMARADAAHLSNVTFLDAVAREEVPAILASADIALVPLKKSLFGAVPSKIYEAMASGIPVVLSAEGEAAEIVRDSGAGVSVRPGDSDALAEVLRRLTLDPDYRCRLGDAGVGAAKTRFNRVVITDAFIDYLEQVL